MFVKNLLVGGVFLLSQHVSAAPITQITSGIGQLGSPTEYQQDPKKPSTYHLVQRSIDGRLILTPNESFFSTHGLKLTGTGSVPDIDGLNQRKSFEKIIDWEHRNGKRSKAEWGLWFDKPGQVTVHVNMSSKQDGGRFLLRLGDSTQFKLQASTDPVLIKSKTVDIDKAGFIPLSLVCLRDCSDKTEQALHWIEVTGPAVESGAAVVRKRWRPAAAHAGRLTSSTLSGNSKLWVMELDAKPANHSPYSPVTTPFGYYGSSWKADGTVNKNMNFSLWSYGRNDPIPPVEQLSHLLSIGDPNAVFGSYGHEGTGVKVRNWEPLEGKQRQAFALRVEPGSMYDTYFSYFYSTSEQRWRFFSSGRKYNNNKPTNHLWLGAFVEIHGPSSGKRTGAYKNQMRYRGWQKDEDGAWHQLDSMHNTNINRVTGLTHTDRGVHRSGSGAGWLYLETGGWTFREPRYGNDKLVSLGNRLTDASTVDYMDPDKLAVLETVPAAIEGVNIQRGENPNEVVIEYDITNLGDDSEVIVYWGEKEGLTLVNEWQSNQAVPSENLVEGRNALVLGNVPQDKAVFVRLFLKNSAGQFWSSETLTLN